jgi:hypothetical protein
MSSAAAASNGKHLKPSRALATHVMAIILSAASTAEERKKYTLRAYITHCSLCRDNMEAWAWRTSGATVLDKTVLLVHDKLDDATLKSFDAADATKSWVRWQRMTPEERKLQLAHQQKTAT